MVAATSESLLWAASAEPTFPADTNAGRRGAAGGAAASRRSFASWLVVLKTSRRSCWVASRAQGVQRAAVFVCVARRRAARPEPSCCRSSHQLPAGGGRGVFDGFVSRWCVPAPAPAAALACGARLMLPDGRARLPERLPCRVTFLYAFDPIVSCDPGLETGSVGMLLGQTRERLRFWC
jgi:hypothetical protein